LEEQFLPKERLISAISKLLNYWFDAKTSFREIHI
jgi:hypothetical protein